MVTESDNLTLSCLVSQRKRSNSALVLRWFFSPPLLIVRLGIKKMKLYGNYTRRFPQPKFRLYEEMEEEAYRLLIVNVTGIDQGFYTCRVQEVRKHRSTWRASSNGTSTTQLTVHFTHEDSRSEGVWRLFADVYLCAVLICSLGLLSIFLFTLVLICQYLHKCLLNLNSSAPHSSGETVTSSASSSSSSPRAQRKEIKQKPERKVTSTAPKVPEEPPPHIPTKGKLLFQCSDSIPQEDSLTYAELELVRPRPEPPASSNPSPSTSSPDTVYAQILFQEKRL
uniref:V-set and transmembrane domain containing 4a n=1 Tax=Myripristis murdjan TaxID=586833 RepID=A0A667WZJ3_9TELE